MTADIIITVSLCRYLRQIRSGISRSEHFGRHSIIADLFLHITDKMIDVLILYTVNTGLVTLFVTQPL